MSNELKTLDLRFKGRLSPEVNNLFNEIAIKEKNSFNQLIDFLSKPNIDNIDWWVNELPSRNTFASPFFHYYCCIHLVIQLAKQLEINYEKIIVDTEELKNTITEILLQNKCKEVDIIYKRDSVIKFKIKKYFGQGIAFIYNLIKWRIAKISKNSTNKLLNKQNLILIDTFVIDGYTNSKRWYGKFWESLNNDLKNKIYFVSTISKVSFWKLNSIYKEIRSTNENYIIKEDHIEIIDLIFALTYKRRLKSLKIKTTKVVGINITDLVKECIYNPIEIFSIQESLLTYRFIERLKKNNISVKLSIDWFEGQIIDKAWSLAFHKFFPNINTTAYRCFESYPLYLCSYPIPVEVEAGVVPKVFALQGKQSMQSVKEYYPNLKTILIPSYKSDFVWEKRNNSLNHSSDKILIALPISLSTAKHIVSKIISLTNTYPETYSNYHFIFKPHPTKSPKIYFSGVLPKNVSFTREKSFSSLLKKSKILITEASSTCLESISIGVPVILMKKEDGLFYNPLPNGIHKILFKICSSLDQLNKSLNYYISMNKKDINKIIDESHKVRNDYFEPISEDGTKIFLNIN